MDINLIRKASAFRTKNYKNPWGILEVSQLDRSTVHRYIDINPTYEGVRRV